MTRFLVTGAGGFVGGRFAREAVSRGHEVHSLLRRLPGTSAYPPGKIFFGTLPYEIPLEAFEGVETLIHCAAVRPDQASVSECAAVNVRGLLHLMTLSRRAGIRKIVMVSGHDPQSRECEALLTGSGVPYTILRPGLVYGPPPNADFGRLARTVKRLPLMPLVDGGSTLVQPLHVDDLVEAMLQCVAPGSRDGQAFELGHPGGVSLKRFLGYVAKGARKRKPLPIDVPLASVEAAVHAAETVGFRMPALSWGLKSMRASRNADTQGAMREFQLPDRNLPFEVAQAAAAEEGAPSSRPLRMLLAGAGRAGLPHALTLLLTEGATLCGVTDASKHATELFSGMGIPAPGFSDLEQAIQETGPDAVVIATPTHTHYSLARMCLERGIATLVEAPLSATAEGLSAFVALARRNSGTACAVGYALAQCAHVADLQARLRAGEWGKILSARAHVLQPFLSEADDGWRSEKTKCGGGVVIHGVAQLLAVLEGFLGLPSGVSGDLFSGESPILENAADLTFDFAAEGLKVPVIAASSLRDLQQSELCVQIRTERARIRLSTGHYEVHPLGGGSPVIFRGEQDFAGGFSPAPGSGGSGVTIQHRRFSEAVRARTQPAWTVERAAAVEEWIHRTYSACTVSPDAAAAERTLSRTREAEWNA